jgi:zinc transport system substrate-binding protein
MHRIVTLLKIALICVFGIILTACQGQDLFAEKTGNTGSMTVVTSFYPVYIATINITRDVPGVNVINMTHTSTGCLHDYQLKPDDIKTLAEAQVFVINGAGAESFIDKVTSQLPDLIIVDASIGIPLIEESGHLKESHGYESYNPHVWVSISNAIEQVKNIERQLSRIDPENAGKYSMNAEVYIKKLEALKSRMHQALDTVKNKEIITFHEAFAYFADEFKLNVVAVIEREPGSQPSAAELSKAIEVAKNKNIKAIFAEPQYPSLAAETVAREANAKVYYLDPAVSGAMDPDAYINIMEANMKILKEALN